MKGMEYGKRGLNTTDSLIDVHTNKIVNFRNFQQNILNVYDENSKKIIKILWMQMREKIF